MIHASRAASDFEVSDLDNKQWDRAQSIPINKYWSGADAPETRHSSAQLLWTERALYVRFISNQGEPPVVSAMPKTNEKSLGLWDRDVCEIYIGTRPNEPERYFEFEAAPTGEWIDLGIRQLSDHRETDWDFKSGMTAAGRVEHGRTVIAMRIPWKAIGASPRQGARFRTNLYRCVGSGKDRGYLAWRPTHSPEPNFHVPAAFGWLELS
jgi:hypothetical protein